MEKNYLTPIYEELNGITYKVYKSPNGKKIQKVGTDEIYSEAWDLAWVNYNYIETDEDLEKTEKVEDEQTENI